MKVELAEKEIGQGKQLQGNENSENKRWLVSQGKDSENAEERMNLNVI